MQQADLLIERVSISNRLPNLLDFGKLRIGKDVPDVLQYDLDMDPDAIPDLRAGIAYCGAYKGYVSDDPVDDILISEEGQADWPETLLEPIDQIGPQNYLLSAK